MGRVGERFCTLRRQFEKTAGGIRSANADMSSVKAVKSLLAVSQGFLLSFIGAGVSRPLRRGESRSRWEPGQYPGPISSAKGDGVLKIIGCWMSRFLIVGGQ